MQFLFLPVGGSISYLKFQNFVRNVKIKCQVAKQRRTGQKLSGEDLRDLMEPMGPPWMRCGRGSELEMTGMKEEKSSFCPTGSRHESRLLTSSEVTSALPSTCITSVCLPSIRLCGHMTSIQEQTDITPKYPQTQPDGRTYRKTCMKYKNIN